MSQIETLDDEKSEGEDNEDIGKVEREWNEIPDGLPGSRNPRKRPSGVSYSRPEQINIGGGESVRRRPGRPRGSGNATKQSNSTSAENFWTTIVALGFNLSSGLIAARVLRDPKFIMTKPEAESAGKAVVLVLWKYKQFRDMALIVNSNSDWAIIMKGFWPYAQRVFLEEFKNELIRFAFSGPQSKQRPVKSPNVGNSGQPPVTSNAGRDAGINGHNDEFPAFIQNNGVTDWRAL